MSKKSNLIGIKFGKWEVLNYFGKTKNGSIRYLCRCECGKEKVITGSELTRGNTRSCRPCSKIKHGDCGSILYMVWGSMVQRCINPKNKGYVNYGGRGITVCEEWRNSYASFLEWAMTHGYKRGLLLDRIDNDIGYTPENCTFSTRYVQNNNRRSCRFIEIAGVRLTIAQQAARFRINKDSLRSRVNRGWTGDEIIIGLEVSHD